MLPFILATLVVLTGPGADQVHAQDRQVLRQRPPAVTTQLKPLRALAATNQLRLAIGLPLRHPEQLEALLQDLYDPASPNYRHFLTPQEFTARFGPSAADYQAVIQFAQTNGLTVIATHPNRVVLDVTGPVASIESALHVKLQVFPHPHEARNFYAPDASPALDLNVPVLHISGLDNYSLPHPNSILKPKLSAAASPRSGSAPGGAYMGGDFRAAYVPGTSLTGAGQSVGLLQFDGYYSSDITAYASQAGFPAPTLINVPIDGGVSSPGTDNAEVALDIEMAMSMAPGLTAIYVYEAPNPSPWVDLLSRMANDNLAKQLSCSWGGGSPDATSEQIFKQMAAQGQSFFNATGDSDAFTTTIDFPSDSTNITQVGGTTLSTTGPGGSYVSETVWNWGLYNGSYVGSSGGTSTYYGIPGYQQGIDMTACHGSTTLRNVPDVALAGDDIYVRYDNGSGDSFGGTSCSAPLWAGFMALVNQQAATVSQPPLGFLNPALYAIGKGSNYLANFHDITTGNNFSADSPANYSAVPGYDLCTGWGTPVGVTLINTLAPLPNAALVVTNGFTLLAESCGPANGAIDPGEPVTVSVALRNVGVLPTANLVATLLATNGIVLTGVSTQYYGPLAAGGGTASNSFTFTAAGTCGSSVTALLQLQDGTNNLGTLAQLFRLGTLITTNVVQTDATQIKIPARSDYGKASPFPSKITVSGLTNPITKVTVTLNGLTHTYPSDIDVLLVGPQGQTVMLMADAGYSFSINDVVLTFDDAAASAVPFSGQITSGTYRPSSYASDVFSSPAPSGSYGSSLAAFTGQDPNGAWSLYIQDFAPGDVGSLVQGWTLNLTTGTPSCCAGGAITTDLALGLSATPDLVNLGEPVTLSLHVTNQGPDTADGVTLTNILPAGLEFVSATPAASTRNDGVLTFALGSLTNGAVTTITIQTLATNAGSWANTASTATTTSDLIAANNNQTTYVTVNAPPGISGLGDVTIDENTMTGPLAFTIGDAETAAAALTLTASSDNPALLPATNIVFGGSGANRTVAVTPALNHYGSTQVTVTVDDGLASTSATFLLTVNRVNLPPVLTPVPHHFLRAGSSLAFTNTATDPDLPDTTLTFALTSGAETGASVDAATGRFFWQTSSAWPDATNSFTVKVTDTGVPPLSDSQTFQVTLTHQPVIETVVANNGMTTLTWSALAGETYRLQYKNSLTDTNWTDVPGDIPANGDPTTATEAAGTTAQRFYRVLVLP
ncbi:MAG TPA: protease pro-enzyme activation domain-containing protein [Dongiaceae bacterium]|nr:protease pro-enzyme activation domain-containing protein [Dongiaceae bacterium]